MIKEFYLNKDQHCGNWYMNQVYYQLIFFGHNNLIDPSSENMIFNGDVLTQLVTNSSKEDKYGYECTGGSVTSLR